MTLPTVQPENADQQVFQPVPTQDDMLALSHQVRQARQGQARMLITAIFLAGVIAAGVIAVGLIYNNSNAQLAAADQKIEALTAQLQAKDAQIAARDTRIAEQQALIDSFAAFQSIVLLQQQARTLEAEIAELLQQPSRANAPRRLTELPPQVEWLDNVVSSLRARRDALQALKAEVQAWPPIPPSPRPD